MIKTKSGFTIVELLIVIVVIGILAAITVVAYNNVQQRARNTVTVGAAKEWIKVLATSYALNGAIDLELPSGDNSVCLGTKAQYPAVNDDLAEGQCYAFAHTSDELEAAVKDIANINMTTYVTYDGTWHFRGLQYGYIDATPEAHIWYDLVGDNADCVLTGSEVISVYDGITTCELDVVKAIGDIPIRY